MPPPTYPVHDYYADMQQRDRGTQIERTKTGLLLLIVGIIIGQLPVVSFIGGILNLIGAILVILGRKAFGSQHARNTILSLVLYIVGFVIIVAGGFAFAISILGTAVTGTVDQAAIVNGVNVFLFTIIIASIFTGIGTVLFTYSLQLQTGKILLWSGYAISLAVSVVVFLIISPIVASTVASAFSSGTYDALKVRSLQGQVQGIQLLGIIPSVIFAVAFFMARQRIERGEIPAPQPPMTPTTTTPGPSG